MRTICILATLTTLLALAPLASAQPAQSTVWLHDLVTEDGSYVGCHVTSETFNTFRMTVQEGQEVQLTVRSFANNTNTHTVDVLGTNAHAQVAPGGTGTLTFTADEARSYVVSCDGATNNLQGTVIARPATQGETGGNAAPAPGALPLLVLVALAGLALRRRGVA